MKDFCAFFIRINDIFWVGKTFELSSNFDVRKKDVNRRPYIWFVQTSVKSLQQDYDMMSLLLKEKISFHSCLGSFNFAIIKLQFQKCNLNFVSGRFAFSVLNVICLIIMIAFN